jgi:hypothetical protein
MLETRVWGRVGAAGLVMASLLLMMSACKTDDRAPIIMPVMSADTKVMSGVRAPDAPLDTWAFVFARPDGDLETTYMRQEGRGGAVMWSREGCARRVDDPDFWLAPAHEWNGCAGRPLGALMPWADGPWETGLGYVRWRQGDLWPLAVGNTVTWSLQVTSEDGQTLNGKRVCRVTGSERRALAHLTEDLRRGHDGFDLWQITCTAPWAVERLLYAPALQSIVAWTHAPIDPETSGRPVAEAALEAANQRAILVSITAPGL